MAHIIVFSCFFLKGNQNVKSIIVTRVTVMSPVITNSSQTPWKFLDMEVIMIKRRRLVLMCSQLNSTLPRYNLIYQTKKEILSKNIAIPGLNLNPYAKKTAEKTSDV